MNKHLILIGLMGCGKSTVARLLRRKLEMPIYEVDNMIEQAAGKPIPEIFNQEGESAFRKIEKEVIQTLATLPPGIVSTGGGTFISEENKEALLNSGWVFYLYGSPHELAQRIQSTVSRPLLHGRDKGEVLQELFVARDPHYQLAHVLISTDRRTSHEVTSEIFRIYRQKENGGKV